MKLLYDYFPIVCFFIAFKLFGIYVATATIMAAVVLQVGLIWLWKRQVERLYLISLVFVLVLGGATLFFHNVIFIKWKPSVVYWVFAGALLGSQFFTHKPLIARFLDQKIDLPSAVWSQLNVAWSLFFIVLGIVNLYVVYHYDTHTWVNFKLFGTLGATLAFGVLQGWYMFKKGQEFEGKAS